MPTAQQVLHGQGELEVELWTSAPCHLTLRWTSIEPVKTSIPKEKRGAVWYYDNKLCFVAWQDIEQMEAGDTTLHTFLWPGWAICTTRWFIFMGTIGGAISPSNTAIFSAHYGGATDMITLGKFGEAQVLLGNVKLKEGANITITRVDADNALQLAATITPPAYTPPNLVPKLDWLADNLPANTYGKLAVSPTLSTCYFHPPVGEKALFTPLGNLTTGVRQLQLLDFSHYTLAVLPANCGFAMPTRVVNGRYIYYPQGFSASGVRGSGFYRYDLFLDVWATMAAITTLNASYRFASVIGVLWDGGNYIYCIGGYDGVDTRALFRYSISGDSWAELADCPGNYAGAALCEGPIGDFIYALRGSNINTFWRYSISGDAWDARAVYPGNAGTGGLYQDPEDADLLYALSCQIAEALTCRYSISGDAWTNLAPANQPAFAPCKGMFITDPIRMILCVLYNGTPVWVYKL